jgi:predicted Zn-dependent protease
MNYDKIDNDELLHLALGAMSGGQDADSIVMLKTLLERDPANVHGLYLLAAQHAQMGMVDRAEDGFRSVVTLAPDMAIARFQLGQLLLLKGAVDEASHQLGQLCSNDDTLGAYARALSAAANEDIGTAIEEVSSGLALPQEIPALASDMQRLKDQWRQIGIESGEFTAAATQPLASPMFLAGYGREI